MGQFKNACQTYCKAGEPTKFNVHDFNKDGLANPYGCYDQGANEGWVSIGDHKDTGAFAVATILN